MITPTITPAVIGLGKAVHVASGTGTRCRPSATNTAPVPHESVTCKRCLAMAPAPEPSAPAASSTGAKRSSTKTPQECRCGCGELTGGGNYRPGHDARHAGNLVRAVVAGRVELADALGAVASDALRVKITRGVERAAQKGAAA